MPESDSRVAVYTGSFDPISLGHLSVIARSRRLLDKLVVGVGINVEKPSLFTPDERVDLVRRVTRQFNNVEVRSFTGLAVEFVRACDARVMIRGVRSVTDIPAEFTMTMANRHLDPDIETIFLLAEEKFAHVSSSLIKQITPVADDDKLARFVPYEIIPDLRHKISESR